MYKVVAAFADGERGKAWPPEKGGHFYNIGDTYPREGLTPSQEHIAYLLGAENNMRKPLIEAVNKPKPKKKEGGTGGARAKGKAAGEAETPPEPDGGQ